MIFFLKTPCEGDENFDYFISLMMKFINTKYRHLYKQPPSPSNPLDTFCFSHEWNWLPWWLFWCHCSFFKCINTIIGVCYFCLMNNLNCLSVLNEEYRWDILRLQNHELINMDLQHLTMHSMPSSLTYIQYFCMYVQHMTNFKKIQSLHEWKVK
jgi:hypothetical protein